MNYYPYLPLLRLNEFIEKLEAIGVEKIKSPFNSAENQPTFYLRRTYEGKSYNVMIPPSLRGDSFLSVAIIDNILKRLKVDKSEVGLDYLRI